MLNLSLQVLRVALETCAHLQPHTCLQAVSHTYAGIVLVRWHTALQEELGKIEVVHDEAVHLIERRARVVASHVLGGELGDEGHGDAIGSLVVELREARSLILIEPHQVHISHGPVAECTAYLLQLLGGGVQAGLCYSHDEVGTLDEVVVEIPRVGTDTPALAQVCSFRPPVEIVVADRLDGHLCASDVAHNHQAGVAAVVVEAARSDVLHHSFHGSAQQVEAVLGLIELFLREAGYRLGIHLTTGGEHRRQCQYEKIS